MPKEKARSPPGNRPSISQERVIMAQPPRLDCGPGGKLRSMPEDPKPPKAAGMKSAYELALERLESRGIERPKEESLTAEGRQKIGEIRQAAEAKLAELEILHKDRLRKGDPMKRQEEEDDYLRERKRIEAERDRKIEKVRAG